MLPFPLPDSPDSPYGPVEPVTDCWVGKRKKGQRLIPWQKRTIATKSTTSTGTDIPLAPVGALPSHVLTVLIVLMVLWSCKHLNTFLEHCKRCQDSMLIRAVHRCSAHELVVGSMFTLVDCTSFRNLFGCDSGKLYDFSFVEAIDFLAKGVDLFATNTWFCN